MGRVMKSISLCRPCDGNRKAILASASEKRLPSGSSAGPTHLESLVAVRQALLNILEQDAPQTFEVLLLEQPEQGLLVLYLVHGLEGEPPIGRDLYLWIVDQRLREQPLLHLGEGRRKFSSNERRSRLGAGAPWSQRPADWSRPGSRRVSGDGRRRPGAATSCASLSWPGLRTCTASCRTWSCS